MCVCVCVCVCVCMYAYIPRVGWGNLGHCSNLDHFRFSLISLKQNGLTAGAASMDCISPLPSEMSAAVPSAFCSWM